MCVCVCVVKENEVKETKPGIKVFRIETDFRQLEGERGKKKTVACAFCCGLVLTIQ